MNRTLWLTALGAAVLLLALTGPARAAADPDLIVLDAKVNANSTLFEISKTKIEFHNAQHEALAPVVEAALMGLGDARRRDIEALLFECALSPADCLAPSLLTSNLDPECLEFDDPAPPAPGEHEHDTGYRCPLKEIIETVREDIVAAEAQGLERDFEAATLLMEDAMAAAEAGEPAQAFRNSCAAFKLLACP